LGLRREVAHVALAAYHSAAPLVGRRYSMQKIGFAEALDSIVANDARYHRDAYVFLRDALDFAT
jgi:hypothetical protein